MNNRQFLNINYNISIIFLPKTYFLSILDQSYSQFLPILYHFPIPGTFRFLRSCLKNSPIPLLVTILEISCVLLNENSLSKRRIQTQRVRVLLSCNKHSPRNVLVSTITLLVYERLTLENGPRAFFFRMPGGEVGDSQANEDKVYRVYDRVRAETRWYSRASNALLLTPLVK